MSRCLSDRALLRLHVGDGTSVEHAHRAACATCDDRAAALARDIDWMSWVLAETTAPRSRPVRARRAWLPAIGLATAAVVAVLWGTVGLREPIRPAPPAGQPPELGALLQDVSTVMFSVSGDPERARLDLGGDDGFPGALATGCDLADDWTGLTCGASSESAAPDLG